jgi:hypothetical protein
MIYLLKLPRFEKKVLVAFDWSLGMLFSKDLSTSKPHALFPHHPQQNTKRNQADSFAIAAEDMIRIQPSLYKTYRDAPLPQFERQQSGSAPLARAPWTTHPSGRRTFSPLAEGSSPKPSSQD